MTETNEKPKVDPRTATALEIIAESVEFSQQHPDVDHLKWQIFSASNFVERGFTENDFIACGSRVGAEALFSLAGNIRDIAFTKGDFDKSEKIAEFINKII